MEYLGYTLVIFITKSHLKYSWERHDNEAWKVSHTLVCVNISKKYNKVTWIPLVNTQFIRYIQVTVLCNVSCL